MNIYLNNDKANCCGCGACVNICPHCAISMAEDEYGFRYPQIDTALCTQCGLCAKTCEKVHTNDSGMPLRAFAASHRNKQVLQQSSSGGVFSALAQHFLENGGAVCGCIYDDKLNAIHICTEKVEDLVQIRKSKYFQSDVGLVYQDIKKRLKQGQQVLFTGTPCQVAALYAVVGKNHENLTTMDLICHGVPSQRVFNQFIKYLEKRHKTKIVSFDFRSKKYGWPRFTMEFTDSRGRTVNIGKAQEFYMPSFTGGNLIRESCLSCPYACANRVGDITMGDLWGYEKIPLTIQLFNGTSLFTLNTPQAEKWFNILSENLNCEEIDYALAVKGNHCLHQPTAKGDKRELYMDAIKNDTIDNMALRYRRSKKKLILREKLRFMIPTRIFASLRKMRKK